MNVHHDHCENFRSHMIMLLTHLTQYNVRFQVCNGSATEDSSLLW